MLLDCLAVGPHCAQRLLPVNSIAWKKLSDPVIKISWALFFVTLPVTSFPLFPSGPGGKTLVRPMSVYPLFILLILVTIPRLLKQKLPRTFLPLLAFVLAVLISSTLAFTSESENLRGISMLARTFRNLVTLGLGVAFYFTIALLPKNREDITFSLRWLYIGFAIALLWGSFQSVYVLHFHGPYFKFLNQLQSLVSTRRLFNTRISGLTYEPKWFAEQICFLLVPWLLGSILADRSISTWRLSLGNRIPVGRRKIGRLSIKFVPITIEVLMLIWACGILVFTYSRTGLIILSFLIVLSFILYRIRAERRRKRLGKKPARSRGRRAFEVMLIVLATTIILVFIGSQNPYFSRFWRYWTEADKQRKRTYLEFIAVQQRFVYVETALRMYDAYPIFGVGLGNYAFYFAEMIPDEPWSRQPELVRQITPVEGHDRLITPKNLIARLLAETGLSGTITFLTFILAILGCTLYLWFSPTPEQRFWGLSGLLGMFVLTFVVFSVDSFAMPNMWVFFGLMTAAAHIPDPDDTKATFQANATKNQTPA